MNSLKNARGTILKSDAKTAGPTHAPTCPQTCLYTHRKISHWQIYFKPSLRRYRDENSTTHVTWRLKTAQAKRTLRRTVCGGLKGSIKWRHLPGTNRWNTSFPLCPPERAPLRSHSTGGSLQEEKRITEPVDVYLWGPWGCQEYFQGGATKKFSHRFKPKPFKNISTHRPIIFRREK
jgi:predicted acyl esterase